MFGHARSGENERKRKIPRRRPQLDAHRSVSPASAVAVAGAAPAQIRQCHPYLDPSALFPPRSTGAAPIHIYRSLAPSPFCPIRPIHPDLRRAFLPAPRRAASPRVARCSAATPRAVPPCVARPHAAPSRVASLGPAPPRLPSCAAPPHQAWPQPTMWRRIQICDNISIKGSSLHLFFFSILFRLSSTSSSN
ncbi:hypothetical protein ABZP36_027642 [Zizania latifolia]